MMDVVGERTTKGSSCPASWHSRSRLGTTRSFLARMRTRALRLVESEYQLLALHRRLYGMAHTLAVRGIHLLEGSVGTAKIIRANWWMIRVVSLEG